MEEEKQITSADIEEWKKNLPPGIEADQVALIESIEFPYSGGIYSNLRDFRYPFKGYPDSRVVKTLAVVKKAIPIMINLVKEPSVKSLLKFAILMSKEKRNELIRKLLRSYVSFGWSALKEYFLAWTRYSVSVREVYRVLSEIADKMPYDDRRKEFEMLREFLCMLLEYDNAYRFRFQDAFGEMDPVLFKKEPLEEIDRALEKMISRERGATKPKIVGFRSGFKQFTRYFQGYNDLIYEVAQKLDLEKIKLDEGDRYYCLTREDYAFWGEEKGSRMDRRNEIDKAFKEKREISLKP